MTGASVPVIVESEIPAVVAALYVKVGDAVQPGDVVALLESMKMEIPVSVDVVGRVGAISVQPGDFVAASAPLLTVRRAWQPGAGVKFGFLGPEGTFTHEALRLFAPGVDEVAYGTVDDALRSVANGDVEFAIVPAENSVEGGVTASVDALASIPGLQIVGEQSVAVTFVLAAREQCSADELVTVATHPHAWAQVRRFLSGAAPRAAHTPTSSTAAAAELVATESRSDVAAVCTRQAAHDRALHILAGEIEDNPGAITRFVVVGRRTIFPPPTGADRTTVVMYEAEDHVGGLFELLREFATRGVNVTRLESRPTGEGFGSYFFYLDIDGHATDARVAEALRAVYMIAKRVNILGSYAKDGDSGEILPCRAPADKWRSARGWLDMALSGQGEGA